MIDQLKARFEQHAARHKGVSWAAIEKKLTPAKLKSLKAMEESGGEPDVVVLDGEAVFVDCAAETPAGRRSLCFDGEALSARKENKPDGSAVDVAKKMGIELLTEAQYRALQQLGPFDLKTSSWVQTPAAIRKLGGALFCDRRYETVFVYHNGAEAYYAARGFRGTLRV